MRNNLFNISEQCLPVHIVGRNFRVKVACGDMKKDMKEPGNTHVLCVASWHSARKNTKTIQQDM
jgi:hypothetical protein